MFARICPLLHFHNAPVVTERSLKSIVFQKSIPLLWLLDVDPPREEEVGSLTSTGRNVSTGSVRILNCNTILVPNLTFDADPDMPSTFILRSITYVFFVKRRIILKTNTRAFDFHSIPTHPPSPRSLLFIYLFI